MSIHLVSVSILISLILIVKSPITTSHKTTRKLMMIMLDGLRWDYVTKLDTPNLHFIMDGGVKAERLIPVYPTNTFPNLATMHTGLWSESHGVINNYIYDPQTKATIDLDFSKMKDWFQVETLSKTMALQNVTMVSFPRDFEQPDDLEHRVNESVRMLVNEEADAVFVYFAKPDEFAHIWGADVRFNQLGLMDALVGQAIQQLQDNSILDDVNIIVLGDHGIVATPWSQHINIRDCIGEYLYTNYVRIEKVEADNIHVTNHSFIDDVFDKLVNCSPHLKAYRTPDVPLRLHYSHNPRIGQIVLLADLGWFPVTKTGFLEVTLLARHGYDKKYPEMHAAFYARGPDFKVNYTRGPMDMIDVYELVCHITSVVPNANNGSLTSVRDLLK